MSTASEPIAGPEPARVLKPYTLLANDPRRRRWRIGIGIAVALFCFVWGVFFAFFGEYLILFFLIPIAILAALVVWALPASRNPPLKTIEVLFFALFTTLILWPNYLAIAVPGLPWITLIRLTGFPMVFFLLLAISQSADFRGGLADVLRATRWLTIVLIGFVVTQFVSLFLSANVLESIQKFLVAQASWTAIFFVSAYIFTKPGRIERWSVLLWAMLIVLGGIAIVEFRHQQVPWAGHIPGFLKIEDPVVEAILAGGSRAYTGVYRTQATFSTSLGFAEYIALAGPFVLHFLIADYKWPVRLAAFLSVPFVLYMAILTNSRSAMLGLLIACMLWGLFWGILRWRRHPGSVFGPAVVIGYPIAAAVVLTATFFVGRLHRAVWGGGETVNSTQSRIDQWHSGIPLILQNPLGYGIGQGAVKLDYHLPGGLLTIDSYVLTALLEYGVLGCVLFFAMIALGLFYAANTEFRSASDDKEIAFLVPVSISLVNFIMLKTVISEQENQPLLFMMLGIVAALVYRAQRTANAVTTASTDLSRWNIAAPVSKARYPDRRTVRGGRPSRPRRGGPVTGR